MTIPEYRVVGEIAEGRVYALGIPPDTPADQAPVIQRHLADLQARTKAEVIVFVEPLTLSELESQALTEARIARGAADTAAAKAWEERETYRRKAQALCAQLTEADQRAELLRRQVEDLRGLLRTALVDAYRAGAEIGPLQYANAEQHADLWIMDNVTRRQREAGLT